MSLLTLHGQSALHATQTRAEAESENWKHRQRLLFHRKWQIKRIECKLHTSTTIPSRLQVTEQTKAAHRSWALPGKILKPALSSSMCIQRATNWHTTCTQTSLIQTKREFVWFDLLPSARCLWVRSFLHTKSIFFSQFITTSMCVSDLFTSFLAFYFIVQSDGVTELWRRNNSNVR